MHFDSGETHLKIKHLFIVHSIYVTCFLIIHRACELTSLPIRTILQTPVPQPKRALISLASKSKLKLHSHSRSPSSQFSRIVQARLRYPGFANQ